MKERNREREGEREQDRLTEKEEWEETERSWKAFKSPATRN